MEALTGSVIDVIDGHQAAAEVPIVEVQTVKAE